MNMRSPTYPIAATTLIWVVCVSAYAAYYVGSRLALPGLQGYEAKWSRQLLFFGLT